MAAIFYPNMGSEQRPRRWEPTLKCWVDKDVAGFDLSRTYQAEQRSHGNGNDRVAMAMPTSDKHVQPTAVSTPPSFKLHGTGTCGSPELWHVLAFQVAEAILWKSRVCSKLQMNSGRVRAYLTWSSKVTLATTQVGAELILVTWMLGSRDV